MMSDNFYDEFYRQRRNLILISVILFFMLSSGLDLQEIDVWGNKLKLHNPDGILTFLWIVWAYWVWRFWVYALEYPNGFVPVLLNAISDERHDNSSPFYEYGGPYRITGKRSFLGVRIERKLLNVSTRKIEMQPVNSVLSCWLLFPILIRTALSHKSFTDQVLPFLIAMFPTLFIIWTKYIL